MTKVGWVLFSVAALATAASPADPPRFEVASVKLTPQSAIQTGYGNEHILARPGSLIMRNVRLRACIKWAYDVKDYQISAPSWMGSPGWLGADLARFEISAKATPETSVAELRRMLQTLLAERFKLEFHRQSKETNTFAMTVAKNSLLHPSDDQEGESEAAPPRGGPGIILKNTTMAQFAELISGPLRVPVIDLTRIQGRFDINLDMSAYVESRGEDPFVLIKAIQDQLGLKIEKQKIPLETLIIDRAEKLPSEN